MGGRSAFGSTPKDKLNGSVFVVVSSMTTGFGLLGGMSKNKERVLGLQDMSNRDIKTNSTLLSVLFVFFKQVVLEIAKINLWTN